MNINEFVEKNCSRCINKNSKNDLCNITKDFNGKLKCTNFQERGKIKDYE